MNFKSSLMYKILQLEKKEIEDLKWIESEKNNSDIGYKKAIYIWKRYHKDYWLRSIFLDLSSFKIQMEE